jgi:hypothetical protein
MVYARVFLNDYANKVLNVVKAKFDLKDKSEAINRFMEMYGEEIVEKEASEEYTKKVIAMTKKHYDQYGAKKMSKKEFNDLFELN